MTLVKKKKYGPSRATAILLRSHALEKKLYISFTQALKHIVVSDVINQSINQSYTSSSDVIMQYLQVKRPARGVQS